MKKLSKLTSFALATGLSLGVLGCQLPQETRAHEYGNIENSIDSMEREYRERMGKLYPCINKWNWAFPRFPREDDLIEDPISEMVGVYRDKDRVKRKAYVIEFNC